MRERRETKERMERKGVNRESGKGWKNGERRKVRGKI